MKKFFALLLFVFMAGNLRAQSQIDSLLREINKPMLSDSLRAFLHSEIAFEFAGVDPQRGLVYADSAISFAQKAKNPSLETSAHNSKGVNYWYLGEDSLASVEYQKVLEEHLHSGNLKGQATASNNLALLSYNRGDYRSALENHEKASRIFEELDLRKNLINSLANTGVVFLALADYPKALEYFLEAMKKTENGDIWERGNISNNLGLVYKNLGEFTQADSVYQVAVAEYEKNGNLQAQANSLGNLAAVKQLQGELVLAEELILEAFKINRKIGNQRRIASDFSTLSSIYSEMNQSEKSGIVLDSAIQLYRSVGERLNLSKVLLEKAAIEKNRGNWNSAQRLELEGLRLAQESTSLEAQKNAWLGLAETYRGKRDFSKALEAFERAQHYKDSIFNDDNRKQILRLQLGHEYDQKAQAMQSEFEKERILLDLQTRESQLKARLYLMGLLVVLLVGAGLFLILKHQTNQRRKLLQQRYQTEISELELKALKAQMNPHFIFNALSSISNFLLKNEPEEADRYLTKFARMIRKILDFSELKEISMEEEIRFLRDYIQIEALRLGKTIELQVENPDRVDLAGIKVPPLLLQPLVENSIWHGIAKTEENGHIKFLFERSEIGVQLSLRDTGKGHNLPIELSGDHQSMGMKLVEKRLLNSRKSRVTEKPIFDFDVDSEGFWVRLQLNSPQNLVNS
ncbi:tetratricopeptide repeat-containing sensor histidine kinase [Algoriphagus hitonicola]|uniref:Tetratricopeptide repeat-containing protein n=1 Tax=Algoriphagus hitonicola TaxID=435880 RepID=A0A1I2NSI7_9BACT|nr:tetratricopeptide repeat protein [Algoriphagus hitonicola]SFG06553.1 Tetratricopeptide repeat-containing protein [Algoriphagus hitonicola]